MSFSDDETWAVELGRAIDREPHSPRLMASLNTRGPALRSYFCGECHQVVNSVATPWCEGGYGRIGERLSIFGNRERNMSETYALAAYSLETAGVEAYAYHLKWLRNGDGRR